MCEEIIAAVMVLAHIRENNCREINRSAWAPKIGP